MIRLLALLTLAMVTGAPAPAARVETKHLIVETSSASRAGRRVTLFVDVTPKPGMHVYAPGQPDYIPVSLTITSNPRVSSRPARFPRPEKYFFKPLGETQLVYSKRFRIVQDVTLQPGAIEITGTLRYQACDDVMCYMPVTVLLSWMN